MIMIMDWNTVIPEYNGRTLTGRTGGGLMCF